MVPRVSDLQSLLADLGGEFVSTPSALDVLEAAEQLLAADVETDPLVWHEYLDRTRTSAFLQALPDEAARKRWADTTFTAIDRSGYSLRTMLAQRVAAHPDHALFQVPRDDGLQAWSYVQVQRRIDAIAAVLRGEVKSGERDPRVALFTENCLEGACCDLACLLHGILNTPLNVHFDVETLVWIFDALEIDVAFTESPARYRRLQAVRKKTAQSFRILLLQPNAGDPIDADARLDELLSQWSPERVQAALAPAPTRGLHDPATVMFTSGSTGRPKGVVFTAFNLVTKRFARAAALPAVGDDEVLLCYLPLFHTFGRYLEMTGAIFWGGTYVFAGNPSADTLFELMDRVQPTGLISIPLRWQQIRDRVIARSDDESDPAELLRHIVGKRLRWGLSAAGYLDPRAFRFFQRHGIDLCSGFGMTEATGGITMTPPGGYRDQSVGIALPGMHVRFTEQGELQIAGPYTARYYEPGEDIDAPGPIPPEPGGAMHWVETGDLFRELDGGHLQIVDRVKDIYKNNRGQTIAPRRVEQRFAEVDGIERTFLAGDGRAYNTLLIVPDRENAVLQALPDEESEQEYFHQIVTAANADLASFERVVNFAVLDRDFDLDREELTPKGSYRRKQIVESFHDTIAELYQSNVVELNWGEYRVLVPRWFYRDLGILETDIEVLEAGLHDTVRGPRLPLRPGPKEGWLQVGDLAYRIKGRTVDLGMFARQPLLWAGNPALEAFCPCKPGWDTPLEGIDEQVLLPDTKPGARAIVPVRGDRQLATADALCRTAQFEVGQTALDALDGLSRVLKSAEVRLGTLIYRRLEALARHPDEAVRCRAYSVLVLDEPEPEYHRYLPAFIESGRTFLNTESIAAIAQARVEPRRLRAFRRRLHDYRTQLTWPAAPATQRVFDDLFRLLCDFGRFHPEYYAQVREELAGWVIFDEDPALALRAENHLQRLAVWYEKGLRERSPDLNPEDWKGKLIFQESLSGAEIEHLREVLVGTTFLTESITLIFEGESFELADALPGGIWISRILSLHEYSRYRVSVNTHQGKHFDIQLIIREDIDEQWVMETIFWMIAIHGYPHGAPVLGRFGCCRPELGAISQSYTSDLSVWERIREISSQHQSGESPPSRTDWRKLYVRGMALYFEGWRNSGERIIPGAVSPTNVSVPEPDFREGARIASLTGWRPYTGPLSLVHSLVQNFYQQTASHYPWTRAILDRSWIFDAAAEALGRERAGEFMRELRDELSAQSISGMGDRFVKMLQETIGELDRTYHPPMALECACDRYRGWERVNLRATSQARRQFVEELFRLYRLDRHAPIARYHFFRRTYFAAAGAETAKQFDLLLDEMFHHPDRRPTQMVELSDLQAALDDDEDRTALRRLAFPRTDVGHRVQVLTVGEGDQGHVIVTSEIEDKLGRDYTVREPVEAAEVGQLYRLFLQAGFPKTISSEDRFFIALGEDEEIVGGVCYKELPDDVVHLDGIVVTSSLLDRGLTSALLEDFCTRMSEQNRVAVRTHFFLQSFYQRRGFQIDDRWGGLVKFLTEE